MTKGSEPLARLRLRAQDLDWREVEGEIVALDLRSSTYLAANATGATIWSALAEGATREELVEMLLSAFAISRDQAEADLDRFLEELRARNLLSSDETG